MTETVGCVLFIMLTIAFFGSADRVTDSVPAAITVYRNPEFFRNLTGRREDLLKTGEDRGDAYGNNSEDFYDFDDEYKYPGEPKKPNPPAAPEYFTYFDESPEFQPEPRDISPPRKGNLEEEEAQDENKIRSTTPLYYYHYGNQEDGERETSDEEDRESAENRSESEYSENQDDEKSEEADEKEVDEEDELESMERTENGRPRKKDKYYVPMEKDLQMRVPSKIYEDSREYFNPVLNEGITAFHYPSTYEDLDYYSYEDEERKRPYVDNKKGTREYLKDHSIEEVEDPRGPGNFRAGSKHIIRTVSKIGIKAFKPILYVPRVAKIKKKYKVLHKPILHGWRHHLREVPDDSVYQLSSDYDSDFEFF